MHPFPIWILQSTDNRHSQSVLESVNYDQDRAIDVLLGMSDPNYVSSATFEEPVSLSAMCIMTYTLRWSAAPTARSRTGRTTREATRAGGSTAATCLWHVVASERRRAV